MFFGGSGGGGGDAAGALIGGLLGMASGGMQQALAAGEAAKQRDWAEKMYKHRYRWTTEDMKAAGLNPMLAAAHGGGAGSVPMGTAATGNYKGDSGAMAETGARIGAGLMKANTAKAEAEARAADSRGIRDIADARFLQSREDHERIATQLTAANVTNAVQHHGIRQYEERALAAGISKQEFYGEMWRQYPELMAGGALAKDVGAMLPGAAMGKVLNDLLGRRRGRGMPTPTRPTPTPRNARPRPRGRRE